MAVANVNGALVGGASLKATDFLAIAARLSLTNGEAVPGRWRSPGGDNAPSDRVTPRHFKPRKLQ